MIVAVNKKYQTKVENAYKWDRKYHSYSDLDGTFETNREQLANERKQENAYDRFTEIFEDLPKREQANFKSQYKKIHGYS